MTGASLLPGGLDPDPRRPVRIALAGVAAGILLHGYRFGVVDQDIYLPLIEGARDPARFHPNDLLFRGDVAAYSLFWWAVERASAFLSPERLFPAVYAVSLFVFLLAFGRVCRTLGLSEPAVAAATLIAAGPLPVGGLYPDAASASIHTWEIYVTHRTVATALVWTSLSAALLARWKSALGLGGVVFSIHPISAAPLLAALAAVFLKEKAARSGEGRYGLLFLAAGALPFALLRRGEASPGSPTAIVDATWLEVLLERNPYSFLARWSPLAVAVLGLFAAAWWWEPLPPAVRASGALRRLRAALAGLGIAFLGSVVGADGLRIAGAIQFQVLRGVSIPVLLGAALAAGRLLEAMRGPLRLRLAGGWTLASLVLFDERVFAAGLLGVHLARIGAARAPRRREWIVIGLLLAAFLAASSLGSDPRPLPRRCLALAATAAGVAAVAPVLRRRARGIVPASLGAALLAAAALGPVLLRGRWRDRFDLPGSPPCDGWEEVQRWAREQEGPALYVVPPHRSGWRTGAGRSALVTYKDGGASLLDRDFALEWAERMRAVGGLGSERRWEDLDAADFEALARRYGATHAVVEVGRDLALPTSYRNESFAVVPLSASR